MLWFTADLHFGHGNIIKSCGRPFTDVDEMDEALIGSWNACVEPTDEIYILGDLMFYCKEPLKYLTRLRGRKHLVLGNHDNVWMKKVDAAPFFESISSREILMLEGRQVTLCHCPMLTWKDKDKGGIQLYGHLHNNRADPVWDVITAMPDTCNVGVDLWDYRPVRFSEILDRLER